MFIIKRLLFRGIRWCQQVLQRSIDWFWGCTWVDHKLRYLQHRMDAQLGSLCIHTLHWQSIWSNHHLLFSDKMDKFKFLSQECIFWLKILKHGCSNFYPNMANILWIFLIFYPFLWFELHIMGSHRHWHHVLHMQRTLQWQLWVPQH